MKIQLIDTKYEMFIAWRKYFNNQSNVILKQGNIFDTPTRCIVSPVNSFGFMDGGFDQKLMDFFGDDIELKVRDVIKEIFDGELLVGQSFILNTNNDEIQYLLVAPTMRTLQMIPHGHINAYLAARSIFLTLKQLPNDIGTISITGLCTGIGFLTPLVSAYQMWMAYNDIWLDNKNEFNKWTDALGYEVKLKYGNIKQK